MARFEPSRGKDACRDDGERCLSCGRRLTEIARLREASDALAGLAVDFHYDNTEEFANYVARKLFKIVNHRRGQIG
jgi:hypothetical protein